MDNANFFVNYISSCFDIVIFYSFIYRAAIDDYGNWNGGFYEGADDDVEENVQGFKDYCGFDCFDQRFVMRVAVGLRWVRGKHGFGRD